MREAIIAYYLGTMGAIHVTVKRFGSSLGVELSQAMLYSLSLQENDVLEVETHDGTLALKPAAKGSRVLEAYLRTRPDHEAVYRELAK